MSDYETVAAADFPPELERLREKFLMKEKTKSPSPAPQAKAKSHKGQMERITVMVPPEMKARLKALCKGEMGSMSGQGRHYLLMALEKAEDRANARGGN